MATLIGPTGGYLIAFPVAAAVVGALVRIRSTRSWILLSMAAGLFLIFTSGTLYLAAFYLPSFGAAFTGGFLLFTWWDLAKLAAAAMIYHAIARRWRTVPH